MYSSDQTNSGFSWVGLGGGAIDSTLMQLLTAEAIVPGSPASYQLCKTIYSYHPLGAILADAPITRAQSQDREIKVPGLAESRLVERFWSVWNNLNREGASIILHDLMSRSRTYGISSLGVGVQGESLDREFDMRGIAKAELFFNVLDPLNTSGSLVLSQDANSPAYLKPYGDIRVGGQKWHASRIFPKMNERPIYIEWTDSAFGFVGRSVYQRPLYPLKSFLQSMITDDMVTKKAGLLVYKADSPGSAIDNMMRKMAGMKRETLKAGATGQVAQIGAAEELESLNFQNLDGPYKISRENVLKNIASGASMPASIIMQETMTEGFGEGTEDFKKETQYLDFIRKDMNPAYTFMDRIVMRKAWTPEFFESLKGDYPELKSLPFETWLFERMQAYTAKWPNLMVEPDSEKSKAEDVQMKSAIALAEVMLPELDPKNKAALIDWLAENVNERENLFASKLVLDVDLLEAFLEKNEAQKTEMMQAAQEPNEPDAPKPFAAES